MAKYPHHIREEATSDGTDSGMTQYSHIYSSALQPPRYIILHCNHRATITALYHSALQPPRRVTLRCTNRAATTTLCHFVLHQLRCDHHSVLSTRQNMLLLYSILLILPPTLDKMDFLRRLLLWGSIHFLDGFAASTTSGKPLCYVA